MCICNVHSWYEHRIKEGIGTAKEEEKMKTYTSGVISSSTPGVFYKYFYNYARRLRLEKLLYIELSRSSNGYFKPL